MRRYSNTTSWMHAYKHSTLGVVLIELLIAVSISLIVVSLLVESYLSYLHAAQLQHDLTTLQANIATVEQLLRQEISLAGNIGCARLSADFPVSTSTAESLTVHNRLLGKRDQVTIRYQSPQTVALYTLSINHLLLEVGKNIHFKRDDTLVISDCRHAEIVRVEKVYQRQQSQLLQLAHPLKYQYSKEAEVSALRIRQYFLSQKGLSIKDHGQQAMLVPGISNLYFHYVIRLNNQQMEMEADTVTDWSRVQAVVVDFNATQNSLHQRAYLYINLESAL